MELVRPETQHLASYTAALERGWSADNVRGAVAAQEELTRIAEDPAAFLAAMEDRDAKGPASKAARRIKCLTHTWIQTLALGR